MSLKNLNFSDHHASELPADWTPDKRFIDYQYAPVTPPDERLQKMQQVDAAAPAPVDDKRKSK